MAEHGNRMKLYVWDDVLCDYTCGIMFAVAPSLEEAMDLIRSSDVYIEPDLGKKPTVYDLTEPVCRVVWGGG